MSTDIPKTAIIIAGPTAVGKTEIAYRVASEVDGEIISADARQIYRGMIIGTAAPANSPIKHHLVGVLDPTERCTAAWWAEKATSLINDIYSRRKIPLIVGGTGLYIRALVEGMFPDASKSPEIRKNLQNKAESGVDLHKELSRVDPETANRIHPNNIVRIIRALEIYYSTGKPVSAHFENTLSPAEDWAFLKFHLTRPREELYERINNRTRQMLDSGWVEEVEALLDSGIPRSAPGMEAIGYREICDFLEGKIEKANLSEIIARKTRNYAKRQMTWFRHRESYEKIVLSSVSVEDCVRQIVTEYRK